MAEKKKRSQTRARTGMGSPKHIVIGKSVPNYEVKSSSWTGKQLGFDTEKIVPDYSLAVKTAKKKKGTMANQKDMDAAHKQCQYCHSKK